MGGSIVKTEAEDVVRLTTYFQRLTQEREKHSEAIQAIDSQLDEIRDAVISAMDSQQSNGSRGRGKIKARGAAPNKRRSRRNLTRAEKEQVQALIIETLKGSRAGLSSASIYDAVAKRSPIPVKRDGFGMRFLRPLVDNGTLSTSGQKRGTRYRLL